MVYCSGITSATGPDAIPAQTRAAAESDQRERVDEFQSEWLADRQFALPRVVESFTENVFEWSETSITQLQSYQIGSHVGSGIRLLRYVRCHDKQRDIQG
jgi:hypothetical protein